MEEVGWETFCRFEGMGGGEGERRAFPFPFPLDLELREVLGGEEEVVVVVVGGAGRETREERDDLLARWEVVESGNGMGTGNERERERGMKGGVSWDSNKNGIEDRIEKDVRWRSRGMGAGGAP